MISCYSKTDNNLSKAYDDELKLVGIVKNIANSQSERETSFNTMELSCMRNALAKISAEIAVNLDPYEIAQIEASLRLLQRDNKLDKIYFWGCLATEAPKSRQKHHRHCYYIAFGHDDDLKQHRQRYFYSVDGIEWLLLPARSTERIPMELATVRKHRLLTGDPSHLNETEHTEGIPDTDGGDFREENLLAILVHWITSEAAIVPRNAIYQRPDARSIPNACPPAQMREIDLANYQLFEGSGDLNASKLAVSIDKHEKCVFIKSLRWPGMIAFHSVDNAHGFVYFGDGLRNDDVNFM